MVIGTKSNFLKNFPTLRDLLVLVSLWLCSIGIDRLWLALDESVPDWDPSDHLTRALHYWQAWQQPQIFSGQWWTQLWLLSPSYRAPFVYLMTVPFFSWFGRGFEQATLVNVLFTALLLGSIYQLGKHLFSAQVGLWAAGICLLVPGLATIRTDFLLDYGLVALVTFTFASLTHWRNAATRRQCWLGSLGIGSGLGLILLTKPTGILFLVVPLGWVLLENILRKDWQRLTQLGLAFGLAWLICGSWYSTNWITIFSSSHRSNATSQMFDHDPPVYTWAAWFYYWRALPYLLSWPLVLIPLGCFLLRLGHKSKGLNSLSQRQTWQWLAGFLLGTYGLYSLIVNKDPRHILPCIPVVALVAARGLTLWPNPWNQWLRWGTVAMASLLLLFNLFPIPGWQLLGSGSFPYRGMPWPHSQVVAEIIKTDPYLRSTVAVLSDTPELNAFNIDYYGALADFQVKGRDAGFHQAHIAKDARSLIWFLKAANQGPPLGFLPGQANLKQLVEQSPDLVLQKTWPLPDGNLLQLYHRRVLPVTVTLLDQSPATVRLESVTVPAQATPGKPVSVTYEFSGPWEQLRDGLVMLTWQEQANRTSSWIHDHGLGLGQLDAGAKSLSNHGFRVIERLAMLPPAALAPGTYTLTATYLNRRTGETYPLVAPTVQITLDPQAASAPAPELDLVTQLRQLASFLPQGQLEPIFNEIGRINQYDPTQDYTAQAEQTLRYRLQQDPSNLALAYNLALAQVLQRQVQPALKTLNQITEQDQKNPFAWTYLGFVYLYNWQPQLAETALHRAETLNPQLPELRTLQAIAALMQLNLPKAWQLFNSSSRSSQG